MLDDPKGNGIQHLLDQLLRLVFLPIHSALSQIPRGRFLHVHDAIISLQSREERRVVLDVFGNGPCGVAQLSGSQSAFRHEDFEHGEGFYEGCSKGLFVSFRVLVLAIVVVVDVVPIPSSSPCESFGTKRKRAHEIGSVAFVRRGVQQGFQDGVRGADGVTTGSRTFRRRLDLSLCSKRGIVVCIPRSCYSSGFRILLITLLFRLLL
mmetsp:Transcript_9634/g.20330  ORF Transcript_9634/g.20330 Transcript_9634/m.20330 type:complete len:207 (-) Transcript_9634:428-1048(-)